MTLSEIKAKLDITSFGTKPELDRETGKPNGYQSQWINETRTRISFNAESFAKRLVPNGDKFELRTKVVVAQPKKVPNQTTGEMEVVQGTSYTNHHVVWEDSVTNF